MANIHDIRRNGWQLFGAQSRQGYDWWWHSLTAVDTETGVTRPFFFEFFTCNPALSKDSSGHYITTDPVLGQLPANKEAGLRPSYLMVKAGAWCGEDRAQLHRFFGWSEVQLGYDIPFHIEADDCYLSETESRGHIVISKEEAASHPEWMCDAGEMSWNLRIHKDIAFNVGYGASSLMRRLQLFEMFWHAEGIKTQYEGEIVYNGRHYVVCPDSCDGYADKNWGKNFTTPWVWLSSCRLTSEITRKVLAHSAFDIGGGRPKVGPVALNRKLLADFCYEGRSYEFNFSKFWTGCRTSFECHETDSQIIWHVDQRTWRNRMVTDITCDKSDMLLVHYESPDGQMRHRRLWNGGNGVGTVSLYRDDWLIDRVHAEHVGCEFGEYDL